MSKIARFNDAPGDAWVEKLLPVSTAYTVKVTTRFTTATLNALDADGDDTAQIIDVYGSSQFFNDAIYGGEATGPTDWGYRTAFDLARTGHILIDLWVVLEADLTFDGGTSWTFVWKDDGSTNHTNAGVGLGVDDTGALTLRVGGNNGAADGTNEIYYAQSVEVRNAANAVIFADDFSSGDFSLWDTVFGDATVIDDPFPPNPPPPPPPATAGYRSPFWRFVVLDLATFEILSFFDRLASSRTVTYTLNQPAVATGVVPSDNPEVNIPWPDPDSDPFLNEGSRVLYGFRREGGSAEGSMQPPVWIPRFAGIIMQIEDTAESDNAFSHYTAYDPWQYLFSRPVCNSDGTLPGPDGISFTATAANVIALELLANTIANQGTVGIDAGIAYGGTGAFTGTIETCAAVDINFPQGTTVGQAWQQLANMDVLDIILEPIYDLVDRIGYLAQINIYEQAGEPKDDAIFAWDMPSRSLVGLSRLIEGGIQRANEVKFFAGQGGSAPGGQTIPVQTDTASVAKYGEYWRQTFLPGQNVAGAAQALAAAQLQLSKDGKVTVALSPAPERSPIPFEDYFLGDRVPVYASNRFRAAIPSAALASSDNPDNYQRVYGIPLQIADDATEQIDQMLTAIPA